MTSHIFVCLMEPTSKEKADALYQAGRDAFEAGEDVKCIEFLGDAAMLYRDLGENYLSSQVLNELYLPKDDIFLAMHVSFAVPLCQ